MSFAEDKELHSKFEAFTSARKALVDYVRSKAEPIDSTFTFNTNNGTTTLADMFGDRNDLFVFHNMGKGCKYCTLWADVTNGYYDQLKRRAALVVVNGDDPATQAEFATSRGWKFPLAQDASRLFTNAMGFGYEKEGKYYRTPGVSAFHRSTNGTITRTAFDGFGPGDTYMPIFPLFDLLKDGANGWQPE